MDLKINQEELSDIIRSALVKNGIPENSIIDINFGIDRQSNECYCSVDLGEINLKEAASALSAVISEITEPTHNPVSPKAPSSGGTGLRIPLGSPKNVDDLPEDIKF